MRPLDLGAAQDLRGKLDAYDAGVRNLPGIDDEVQRAVLIEQLLDSVHRGRYVSVIMGCELSQRRADPNDELFDPLKAAILHHRQGDIENAYWLVFLFVHFGRHPRAGWRYARDVYGRLRQGGLWDWARMSADPRVFRDWLDNNLAELNRDSEPRGFGNHRKYESLNSTGIVVESYVNWVAPPRTHQQLVDQCSQLAGGDSRRTFDCLYESMSAVSRFGRTARFDYWTMIGNLGLAPIEPGSTYMQGATGPLSGGRLLYGGETTVHIAPTQLDEWLVELDSYLEVGMQVLEDAICNWQKSPTQFKPFRG